MAKAIRSAFAQQESVMEKVRREVFMDESNCRNFRMEVRTPDGKVRFYAMKELNKIKARLEAEKFIDSLVEHFNDERILWRMAGDRDWSFVSAATTSTVSTKSSKSTKSLAQRFFDYWFMPEELQN
ncbi:MAG: DUF6018 family natural product bioysynthesis protein [Paenisporosarcina sp.]|nr:DUF6018 family natural product bioysynthesis protein [Paenisporosarcina sp.]